MRTFFQNFSRRGDKRPGTRQEGTAITVAPSDLSARQEIGELADSAHEPVRRPWLRPLVIALALICLIGYIVAAGILGVYDGLRDRALRDQQLAQEHYALGMGYLQAGEYELAIAEFDLALNHNPKLREAQAQLRYAKELARTLATPTSETRQDAAQLLYREAVAYYESGNLAQAVTVLEELRGLDPDYQQKNVELMLTTAHYQLGLNAAAQNHLEEAATHFKAVLALKPGDPSAQDQLNMLELYTAALSNWGQDWSAAIQALKGLYAIAPEYKDVRTRLHDAYLYRAQSYVTQGDWCRVAEDYTSAAEVLPLESTVDIRDDALMRCQAMARTPEATVEIRVSPRPTSLATAQPQVSPIPTSASTGQERPTAGPTASATIPRGAGEGRIVFSALDAVRQKTDLYLLNLSTGEVTLLWESGSQPAFGLGGGRLAFRNLDPFHLGLSILDLRSRTVSEMTNHPEDSTPAWSPDNLQIAFASNKHGDRKWRIYVISPGEVRGEGQEWVYGQMPAWSPDGSELAYHGCDERGDNCAVWLMLAGGFNPRRLTSHPSDTAPAWSPDGRQIAFVSARSGNWELYVVDLATGQERRLTDHPAADVAPVWSPSGKQLAFLSNRDGRWAIHLLDIRSGSVQMLTTTGDPYPDPLSERLSWVP